MARKERKRKARRRKRLVGKIGMVVESMVLVRKLEVG